MAMKKNHKGIFCFFGVDGAGKTTNVLEVKKRLEEQGFSCTVMRMNRAGDHRLPFINTLMQLKAKFLSRKKNVKRYHNDVLVDIYRKRGFLFMCVYFLELWLRFFEAKRLVRKRKRHLVLMDRFFYDGLALCKDRYVSFFRLFVPRVKSFFLYATPEVIHKRKKEATAQNIVDYKKRVDECIMPFFDVTTVPTADPLSRNVSRVVKIISLEASRGKH